MNINSNEQNCDFLGRDLGWTINISIVHMNAGMVTGIHVLNIPISIQHVTCAEIQSETTNITTRLGEQNIVI